MAEWRWARARALPRWNSPPPRPPRRTKNDEGRRNSPSSLRVASTCASFPQSICRSLQKFGHGESLAHPGIQSHWDPQLAHPTTPVPPAPVHYRPRTTPSIICWLQAPPASHLPTEAQRHRGEEEEEEEEEDFK